VKVEAVTERGGESTIDCGVRISDCGMNAQIKSCLVNASGAMSDGAVACAPRDAAEEKLRKGENGGGFFQRKSLISHLTRRTKTVK
jgi:hypothetical protein